jgi:competence protein ComEC
VIDDSDHLARNEKVSGGAASFDASAEVGARRNGGRAWVLDRLGGLRTSLLETFNREMDEGRGFLWLPVCFGVGILIYFALPREPSAAGVLVLAFVTVLAAWLSRLRADFFRVMMIIAFVALGASVMKLRTDHVAAAKIPWEQSTIVSGWVVEKTLASRGGIRIALRVHEMERFEADQTPEIVRITIRSNTEAISVGDALSVTARLRPPGGPVIPGGYDFARTAYYDRIGGSGFSYGAARPADLGPPPFSVRIREPLARLRDTIRNRVMAALPGDPGRIAVALVTGDRRGISTATQEAMWESGLGHILAISGLHMALIAGTAFWLIRALLALSTRLALRWPIKKWSAIGALGVATFYLGISGAHIATQRAYIMIAIMFVAVLLDRRAITLRNVALSAFVVLLIAPESVLTASFQMSFAATIALVAAYEELSERFANRPRLGDRRGPGLFGRGWRFMSGLFFTSLVAGLATMPFAIFHFQRTAPLTLVANMLAMPLVATIVMPMVLASIMLMPFGLEIVPLTIMSWGLSWVIAVAKWTSEWTGGAGGVPMAPPLFLLCIVTGFLWLALWRERWRLLGVIPMLAAIPIAILAPRPDILVNGEGTTAAIRGEAGRYSMITGKSNRFTIENWLRADADPRKAKAEDIAEGVLCDPIGCIGKYGEQEMKLSLVLQREAFWEDCRLAGIVVSSLSAPEGCEDSAIVIDRARLRRYGAHAFYRIDGAESAVPQFRIETAYPEIARPWMAAFNSDE